MPDNAEPAQQTKTAHATASAPNQDPPNPCNHGMYQSMDDIPMLTCQLL